MLCHHKVLWKTSADSSLVTDLNDSESDSETNINQQARGYTITQLLNFWLNLENNAMLDWKSIKANQNRSVSGINQPNVFPVWCYLFQVSEYFEKARKLEGRVASDQDLKTSDLLRYYVRDTEAAKNLLYRRTRCLADYENANKALDKARVKGKEVAAVSTIYVNKCFVLILE